MEAIDGASARARPNRSTRAALSALAALSLSCASAGPSTQPEPASLLIDNQSMYLLNELRTHQDPSYSGAANILSAPMPVKQALLLHLRGRWFVTVMREKYAGGPQLALTTASPLVLDDNRGYRLVVLQESFRLEDSPYIPPSRSSTVTGTSSTSTTTH